MWCAANAFESLHGLKHLGVDFSEAPKFNWERLVQNREDYISRLNGIYAENLKNSNVETFQAWGRLAPQKEEEEKLVVHLTANQQRQQDPNAVPDQKLVAKHVLLATGLTQTTNPNQPQTQHWTCAALEQLVCGCGAEAVYGQPAGSALQ